MHSFPLPQGLYRPEYEKDSCGVGFVAYTHNRPSHLTIEQGLKMLENMEHRGAVGADVNVGDGAGMLLQIPHALFADGAEHLGFALPDAGFYGVGMLFLAQDAALRAQAQACIQDCAQRSRMQVLGYRNLKVNARELGANSRDTRPFICQVFLAGLENHLKGEVLEQRLYLLRKRIEKACVSQKIPFYAPSISSRTIVYKGMLTPLQLRGFYADFSNPRMQSALALVHARFSTNTFPSWELSQPFRNLAHNGEINTIRGNRNWMQAREASLQSDAYSSQEMADLRPIFTSINSDSAIFDQAVDFLTHTGRDLAHCMVMMIPEAWDGNQHMSADRAAFYEYHASLLEPWDGPACIHFSDGRVVGATLDRNGLRPGRITICKDGMVVCASETGVLPVAPENIARNLRLQPGRVFLLDLERGRVLEDEDMKAHLTQAHDYEGWVKKHIVHLHDLPPGNTQPPQLDDGMLLRLQQSFGYTKEDLRLLVGPMAQQGIEPIGSMGNDAPIAVLSQESKLLFNYFKQNFAQVTNPAIDPIREELVMSLVGLIAPKADLSDLGMNDDDVLKLDTPLLTNADVSRLQAVDTRGFKGCVLSTLFVASNGPEGMQKALKMLCKDSEAAVRAGVNILTLSDRGVSATHAPLPSLLACAAVHHHLIRQSLRLGVALVIESGEPREIHHYAVLFGYGANAVNPYLCLCSVRQMALMGRPGNGEEDTPAVSAKKERTAQQHYFKAVEKGLLKVFSKMGISTLQSYVGAQIFDCLGLSKEVVECYFPGTHSPIGGVGFTGLCAEALKRHRDAFDLGGGVANPSLQVGGQYQFRRNGEHHAINPGILHNLQVAVRTNSFAHYQRFSKLVDENEEQIGALRALFTLKKNPIPLEEVEGVKRITARFCTGAMSLGSISREVHEDLAIAMNRLGGKSNTGEGGEDPVRFTPNANGDSRNSYIKQVASGRFGVNSHYLVNAKELQIKIAQGAKPGEGGQLPGHKVNEYIGSIRFTTPGVGLISPPPHHDIYSIEDLKQLIFDLKNANPKADVSVKLVSEAGVGTVAAGVAKAKADIILISGHEGGTGASPLSSIQHAGSPWELGLAETQQTLRLNGLRGRVRLQTDGQLKTGRDVVVAALLGAEEFGFSILPLISLGCMMMRVCHLNTCPVGIATQDEVLRKNYRGDPKHVTRYFEFVAREVRQWMAEMGFRSFDEMVGQTECLNVRQAITHWKAKGVDVSPILATPKVGRGVPRHRIEVQQHALGDVLDVELIRLAKPALEKQQSVKIDLPIHNTNLATGTMLGSEISRRYGAKGLADNTIQVCFQGTAGQSFGAFLPRGVSLTLVGEGNDYVCKGLSGGLVAVRPSPKATFDPGSNMIIGNVALYGATGGRAFFNGLAGERFSVRNSGANTVVEGVGDHGCEYMTGGIVLVLGETGRNFAAGMSGGIAYVLDEKQTFAPRCNMGSVLLETLTEEDKTTIHELLIMHRHLTGSYKAGELLQAWHEVVVPFVKVMPIDYKRVLETQKAKRKIA